MNEIENYIEEKAVSMVAGMSLAYPNLMELAKHCIRKGIEYNQLKMEKIINDTKKACKEEIDKEWLSIISSRNKLSLQMTFEAIDKAEVIE